MALPMWTAASRCNRPQRQPRMRRRAARRMGGKRLLAARAVSLGLALGFLFGAAAGAAARRRRPRASPAAAVKTMIGTAGLLAAAAGAGVGCAWFGVRGGEGSPGMDVAGA